MTQIVLLNKPFNTLCQFSGEPGDRTLADLISMKDYPRFVPAGRLDKDSEGLLLLTDDGAFQNRVTHPRQKLSKEYWVQVEGEITDEAIDQLRKGVALNDGITRPALAVAMAAPPVWERHPPVRERKSVPTSWLKLTLTEGRNRQVRRMTAAVGFPTLRLIRHAIGPWSLADMQPGDFRVETVHLPASAKAGTRHRKRR